MMGTYTYGGVSVAFSRPLTEAERAEFIERARGLDQETLGDVWDVNGIRSGDIGKLEVYAEGFEVESGGKVYEIPQAVNAFLALLPPDVTAEGEGTFESDAWHWALRIRGRDAVEVPASLVVGVDDPGDVDRLADAARNILTALEHGNDFGPGSEERHVAETLLREALRPWEEAGR
jgi:hypothetical protein